MSDELRVGGNRAGIYCDGGSVRRMVDWIGAMSEPDPVSVDIDDLDAQWTAYLQAKSNKDAWAKIEEELKGLILGRLKEQNAQVGKINGKPAVGWRFIKTRRFDQKTFRKENPDLAERYMVDSGRNEFGPVTE